MSRSDKNKVGRNIAKTRAGVYGVATGEGSYSTKSGAYKSGQNRFEPSKKDSSVRDNIRTHKKKTGCFLTTAACEYMGKADDCAELNTLRAFRDGHLQGLPDGKKLIEKYYSIAPTIVDALNYPSDHAHIWSVIQECLAFIEVGKFDDATASYSRMVNEFATRLQISKLKKWECIGKH